MKIDSLLERLLYLDPAFVFPMYESVTGNSPETKISRGLKGDGKVGAGVFGLGIGVEETVTYSVSTFQMLLSIWKRLEKYKSFETSNPPFKETPSICWVSGNLTIGEWRQAGSSPTSQVYEIHTTESIRHTLMVQRTLFTSGVGFLVETESALSLGMSIRVDALVKVLFFNSAAQTFIAAPFIIITERDKL